MIPGYDDYNGWDDGAENGGWVDEQKLSNDVSLISKLYIPDNLYTLNDTLLVGSKNDICVNIKKLTEDSSFSSDVFWLRSTNDEDARQVFASVPSNIIFNDENGPKNVLVENNDEHCIVPAMEINSDLLIFASSVPAVDAASTGELIDKMKDGAFTLRYDVTSENILAGVITKVSDSKIDISGASTGVYLVIQNSEGAYAVDISDNKTVNASDISINNRTLSDFENCKMWVESTDSDRITTAKIVSSEMIDNNITLINAAALSVLYDGQAKSVNAAKKEVFSWKGLGTANITYYVDKEGTLTNTKNSGAADEGQAPSKKGTYYIRVTVSEYDNYSETTTDYFEYRISYESPEISSFNNNKYYNIYNASQLMWFAEYINDISVDHANVSAFLKSDIDMKGYKWTGISEYDGELFGNYYTISNLGVDSGFEDGNRPGLFITLGTNAIVESFSISNADVSYNKDGKAAAVIAETNNGTVNNCTVVNSTVSGSSDNNVSAFVGTNNGTISESYSYNCNLTSGITKAGVVASGTAPVNSYYFTESDTNSEADGEFKTKEAFKSGEVTWLLNGKDTSAYINDWTQNIDKGTADAYPVLGNGQNLVYMYNFNGNNLYTNIQLPNNTISKNNNSDNFKQKYDGTNKELSVVNGEDFIWNGDSSASIVYYIDNSFNNATKNNSENSGALTEGGAPAYKGIYYVKVTVATSESYSETTSDYFDFEISDNPIKGKGTRENPYLITSTEDLKWFSDRVNNHLEQNICAKLMNDIDLSTICSKELGSFPTIGYYYYDCWYDDEVWSEIYDESWIQYKGTFDGAGHTIKGLYINQTNSSYKYNGLFGWVGEEGVVKNLTVEGSVNSHSESFATGGLVGYNDGNISNCVSKVTVSSTNSTGILCGNNTSYGKIENSYSLGDVSATDNKAGIVCGKNDGNIYNCYYDIDKSTADILPINSGNSDGVQGFSTEEFASGKAAYCLNENRSVGSEECPLAWYQNLSGEEKDDYPVTNSDRKIVYEIFNETIGDFTYVNGKTY